jgi:hypothetical protein
VPHRRGMKALDVGETIGLIIPPSQVSVLR